MTSTTASHRPSRRAALKAGLTLFGAAAAAPSLLARQDAKRVTALFLVGDYYHNGAMQEYEWRKLLKPTGWRLLFAQAPSVITPEVMAGADLFVLCRYATDTQNPSFSLGWSPDPIVETRPDPDEFMTSAHEELLVKNVRRGMGFISMHCSIWNPKNRQYLDMLGVDTPHMHGPVVATQMYDLNPDHPITQGIAPFGVGTDELFTTDMKPGQFVPLYRSKQDTPPRDTVGAWCRQEGQGRVVALLAGHTGGPYGRREFREILWRSAHWSLNREIPVFPETPARPRPS